MERFQPIFRLSFFIFPVFIVLFMLVRSAGSDLPYVVGASLIFDFFSGFSFGWVTISILAVYFSIHLAKNFISVSGSSFVLLVLMSLLFVIEYFLILSVKVPRAALLTGFPFLILETIIISVLMIFASKKVKLFE
jgi:hypothetical protein